MFYGRLQEAGRMMAMTQKWEHKKDSGNVLQKEEQVKSVSERQLEHLKEQADQNREADKVNAIYNKIMSGEDLIPAEEDVKEAQKADGEEQLIEIGEDTEVTTEDNGEADKTAGSEKDNGIERPNPKAHDISNDDMKVTLQMENMIKIEIGAETGEMLDIKV
ncbi:MAG: hypothetical protein IKW01_05665 [Firmicutes bacterium]|nr:hypothetical protein [Bacillota bacterium]